MATSAGEGTSYEGGGGGAGGKFRKRPLRRPNVTPYDRPQNTLRNPGTKGWLSKLVDPASKVISASAHLFFSSVLRKRLLPPPPPPPQPEANQDSGDRFQQAVLDNLTGVQGPAVADGGKLNNSSAGSGLSEIETLLNQKTFTRSEIDRLTELLHSRTVDVPRDEVKSTEMNFQQPASAFVRQDALACSPMQENREESRLESHRIQGCISTPVVSPQVLEEDVASPTELAKAYMGSRPSKVSPSMLGLRSQTRREDASLLSNVYNTPKSPIMSLVTKPSVRFGVPGNGMITPRSRGRSAIYNMARTPYSRVNPTATEKGIVSTYDGSGGPSASSSSQFAYDEQYGSKRSASKRRSSIFEDDIGSIGAIRRLRQKTNLSTPKSLSLPVSATPLSSRGNGVGPHAAQHPMFSGQKIPSLGPEHRFSKLAGENEDNNSMPGTSYSKVPTKSIETANKILQQLEKMVPKEKSPEGKVLAVREKLPSKLTPNMLRGQALRSLEDVDSSKILCNADDGHKLKDMGKKPLPDARDTCSQEQDKVEEIAPETFNVSCDSSTPARISNGIVPVKEIVPSVRIVDSVVTQIVAQPLPKERAFRMSANEDFAEMDDEIYSNEAGSKPSAEGNKSSETSLVESKAVSSEAPSMDRPASLFEFKIPAGPVPTSSTDLGTSDGPGIGGRKVGISFNDTPSSSTTFSSVVAGTPSVSAFDKNVSPKEPNVPPPLITMGSENVDKIPSIKYCSSSSASESSVKNASAPSEPKPESLASLSNVTSGVTDVFPKVPTLDKVENKDLRKSGDAAGESEPLVSSALATSTSTSSIFSFGAPANNSSLSNGSIDSRPPLFSSAAPVPPFSNFTNQPFTTSSSNAVSVATATLITNSTATATASASNSSPSTLAVANSLPPPSIFKFGSSSIAPLSSVSTVSTISNAGTSGLNKNSEKETASNLTSSPFGGTSFATASTGSSIFGFSASTSTSSANNLSQGSPFGTSSVSSISSQASPAGTGVTSVTQSMPIQFGSSASSPLFGTSGVVSFTSGSSLFGSSASSSSAFGSSAVGSSAFGSSPSSSSLFGSSAAPNVFGSITSFGQSSASSSETNSISSSGATTSLFGSSWQPTSSSIFSSTVNAASSSTGFSFGGSSAAAATNSVPMVFGSSTSASSGSPFSFTSAAASASPSQPQPVFGSSLPVFTAPTGNGDQMNMEDSMAEDPIQASTPTVPVFGQPPISTPSSGFVFGSAAPSAGVPFQFGGQQNQSIPPNPSPFQASGSFGAGGSFSLGSVGDDKSNRRIVRIKHKKRTK